MTMRYVAANRPGCSSAHWKQVVAYESQRELEAANRTLHAGYHGAPRTGDLQHTDEHEHQPANSHECSCLTARPVVGCHGSIRRCGAKQERDAQAQAVHE